ERPAPHAGGPARSGRHEPHLPRERDPHAAVAARPAPAQGPEPLPDDPARRERALLLRAWEGSPLKPASFCALKGLDPAEFEAQIELARRERAERRHALARGQAV
ncbi:MAG: hypothetical protein JSR43_15205, partial [Proteobacteria bacterium]|nr:hypothetical protein [Pseudomonadota bacterium]